jgi:hypothetical protein
MPLPDRRPEPQEIALAQTPRPQASAAGRLDLAAPAKRKLHLETDPQNKTPPKSTGFVS